MCGIAGKVGARGKDVADVVRRMTSALIHRGPDGEGHWNDGLAYFGHRRLSIIDIEGGQQPMHLEHNGHHVIVFNGEIYNYRELRDFLEGRGAKFATRSDTEVLLWLLAISGPEVALAKTVGMFAFAWWDQQRRTLILARDRIGIKPLYYSVMGDGSIAFSSSLESITVDSAIERVLDPEALEYLLTLGYPPAPFTMYQGVQELPPATFLTFREGGTDIRRYWSLNSDRAFNGSAHDAAEQLDCLLDDVIRDHMVSDVPVGAFLSGGVDSSTIVARARKFGDDAFQAFTVSFPDRKYDESDVAARTARHLGVRHSVIPMTQMPVDHKACRFVLEHVGQPFADSSALPMFVVSRAARGKATVVLSGDGGDELFAGYDDFQWIAKIERSKWVPSFIRRTALAGIERIQPPLKFGDNLRQAKKGLRYSLKSDYQHLLHLKTLLDPSEVGQLTSLFGHSGPQLRLLDEFLKGEVRSDHNRALCRLLTLFCLPGDMLRKVDSMSMAASLEVRVPLLDHRLVEFAESLPFSMKISGGVRKVLLRQVAKKSLPAELFSRPKWGFSIPLHCTFSPEFFHFCRDMFQSSNGYVRRWFGDAFLERLVAENESRINPSPHIWSTFTRTHVLWLLVQLETWCQSKAISIRTLQTTASA